MISIKTRNNCTFFSVNGDVTANDIMLEVKQYMAGEQTDNAVWDFTQAASVDISTLEIKGIADSLKQLAKRGQVRKVALVASKTINIGLGKLFAAFAQMAGVPHTYKVFRDMSHAMAWLADNSDRQ